MIRFIAVITMSLMCLCLVGCGPSESSGATEGSKKPSDADLEDLYRAASTEAMRSNVLSQVQTICSQIELYNIQNPATAYDANTARETFWDALVNGNYLRLPPRNPLQNNSRKVGAKPGPGIGWVWGVKPAGDSSTLMLHAVDEKGTWFHEDSWTRASSDRNESSDAMRSNVRRQLQTIRSQIKLYNLQHPATVYDENTSREQFWDALVNGSYLLRPPRNPLQKNSTKVGAEPRSRIGWVWAEKLAGDSRSVNLYAVDENGNWFDEDSSGWAGSGTDRRKSASTW